LGDIVIKKMYNIIKKIILAVFFIYAYNKLALPLDVFIPMNFLTVILIAFLGIPSILMLVLFSVVFI